MIKNKRGATMTGIVIVLLITMGLFFGMYQYVIFNYQSAGTEFSTNYTQGYQDLQQSMNDLDADVTAIKDKAQEITQADANIALVAWNGLTGIAQTLRLMFDLLDVAINIFNAVFPALAFIPSWLKILIEIGIIATIVFVIIGLFKGEQKT
jgi:hypothetical protein